MYSESALPAIGRSVTRCKQHVTGEFVDGKLWKVVLDNNLVFTANQSHFADVLTVLCITG
jgi:hypothetical protein